MHLKSLVKELGVESAAEKIRADGLQQKKRVGLHVPDGAESAAWWSWACDLIDPQSQEFQST